MPSRELSTTVPQAVATRDHQPSVLEIIHAAVLDERVDPAKLSALLDLKVRMDAIDAEAEFNRAFSRMHPMLPRIRKTGKVEMGGKGSYSFARWDDIDTIVGPVLEEHGFTLAFTSKAVATGVLMVCTLSHSAGHSRSSEMQLPADTGAGRNALQAIGSSRSYGKRYLTLDILNLTTVDMDDDGRRGGGTFITQQQADSIFDLMAETGVDKDPVATSKFLTLVNAKSVSEIHKEVYKTAVTLLEGKRRHAK